MDDRVHIVIAIILAAGVIGGWAAFLAEEKPVEENPRRRLARFVLLGVVAAACVPLFLSLVRSQLTQGMFDQTFNSEGRRFPVYYESYLVFAGLCLIAAFSARRFIDSISKQVLRKLDEVEETAQGAAATAATARQVAHEAVEEVGAADEQTTTKLPPELQAEILTEPGLRSREIAITPVERKALKAMEKRTYRTRTGIAEDSGIARTQISEILDSLHQKKLAVPTKSPTTGGLRWIITKRGEAAVQGGH